jgi:hypothetical protein
MTEPEAPARPMKASDIDDVTFLRVIQDVQENDQPPFAHWWDVEPLFPGVPFKVLLAKARGLMKRGYLDGCPCGCRGDMQVVGLHTGGYDEWNRG